LNAASARSVMPPPPLKMALRQSNS
jgi:hypothetical protein